MVTSPKLKFAIQAAHKVRSEGLDVLPWVIGRFYVVRRFYSLQRRVLERDPLTPSGATIFPDINVAEAADAIRKEAVFRSARLPADYVLQLRQFAASQTLTMRNGPAGFRYEDVKDGKLNDGRKITLAQVDGIRDNLTAKAVAEDPVAKAVMRKYLGYTPRSQIRMYWSFVTSATVEERQHTGQTVEWHFDSDFYNFVFASYYLSDVDENSGAHVMVSGSHIDKPTAWLFGSVQRSDDAVRAHYPSSRVMLLEGKAGEGFWQDSSCFHKALPPKLRDRLLLQVRYY